MKPIRNPSTKLECNGGVTGLHTENLSKQDQRRILEVGFDKWLDELCDMQKKGMMPIARSNNSNSTVTGDQPSGKQTGVVCVKSALAEPQSTVAPGPISEYQNLKKPAVKRIPLVRKVTGNKLW